MSCRLQTGNWESWRTSRKRKENHMKCFLDMRFTRIYLNCIWRGERGIVKRHVSTKKMALNCSIGRFVVWQLVANNLSSLVCWFLTKIQALIFKVCRFTQPDILWVSLILKNDNAKSSQNIKRSTQLLLTKPFAQCTIKILLIRKSGFAICRQKHGLQRLLKILPSDLPGFWRKETILLIISLYSSLLWENTPSGRSCLD